MNKIKEKDLSNHKNSCRLCVSSCRRVGQEEINEDIKQIFFEITSKELTSNAKLSKLICLTCRKELESFSKLKQKLISIQNELENYLNLKEEFEYINMTIKVEPETEEVKKSEAVESSLDVSSFVKAEIINDEDEAETEIDDYDFDFDAPEQKKEPSNLSFSCQWCTRKFPDQKLLDNHKLNRHKEKLSPLEVRDIRRRKKNDRKLVCPQCGITTHYLKDHIQYVHLNIKRFFCDHCPYSSFRRNIMIIHMKRHQKPQFVCDLCGTLFARKNSVYVHMNNQHRNEGPLTCAFCQKKCKNRMALWHHRKQHANLAGSKEKCTICNKEILITYMRKHMRTIHVEKTDDQKQLCITCGKMMPNKKSLMHHKRTHKEKKFSCNFPGCMKKFLTENKLLNHEKTHRNQREYICSYPGCDKSYFISRNLKMHVALNHENFRENCPIPDCKFSVGRRDYMRAHVAKHTELGKDLVESLLEGVKENKNLW